MPPMPKPPGQRVRRNLDAPTWKHLEPAKPFKTPAASRAWSASTKKWWKLIWESPMRPMWLESDVPALIRLGNLLELEAKGRISAEMVGEIRQIEDRFGLSPKSRRSLQWFIPLEDTVEVSGEPEPEAKVRHLKAV